MANFRGPYFWQINYHSNYGLHSMQNSLFGWNAGAGGLGDLTTSVAGVVDGVTFIDDYIDLLKPFFRPHVVFDSVQIFRQLVETDLPQPVIAAGFTGKIGTSAAANWDKAVQTTTTWRTAGFSLFKIVLLDSESGSSFNPVFSSADDPATDDLNDFITDPNSAICGRDNTLPNVFIRQTSTLNEKLRKQYHLD